MPLKYLYCFIVDFSEICFVFMNLCVRTQSPKKDIVSLASSSFISLPIPRSQASLFVVRNATKGLYLNYTHKENLACLVLKLNHLLTLIDMLMM